jgi:hypothetical protein
MVESTFAATSLADILEETNGSAPLCAEARRTLVALK